MNHSMFEQLKSLSKETMIYGLSTILGRFLNFLLVPFYVNVLHSTAEYGMATSLYTYIGFLTVIYPLGLEGAFFRYGARAEGQPYAPDQDNKWFGTPFLVVFFLSVVLTALIFVLAPRLAPIIFHDPREDLSAFMPTLVTTIRLASFILLFDSLSVLPFAVLRLEHQAKRFATYRFLGIVLTLLLNFIFVLGLGWGVKGIFWSNLLASAVVFSLLIPILSERMTFKLDREVLRKMLPFGMTNIPAALSSMMVQVIDRPIIQGLLGLSYLGIYQANYRMGVVMMVLVGLFEYAWRPFFMRQFLKDDAQARLLFARVFTYFMLVALLAFLALTWTLPELVGVKIFGRQLLKGAYLSGVSIIPIILLAYVFQGMYTNFIAGIYIKEKNKFLPFITGLGALVNIGFNFWLIPRLGLIGAALATLLAYAVMAFALYRTAQREYFVPYEWPRVRKLALVVFCSLFVERVFSLILSGAPLWGVFFMRLVMFVATLLALYLFDFFTDSEMQTLRRRRRGQV
ncbi:MAG: hypothetical protein KCHDKBKB_02956 [Elusimicrobia bacterium]|nr:hypothetical protein [Elusimicrobiota bacterium]